MNKPQGRPFRASMFTIDEGPVFSGYTQDYYWNGWECPTFDRENTEKILAWVASTGCETLFNEDEDAAVVIDPNNDGEAEVFEGYDISVDGETIHVYAVGAYSWIWDEVAAESTTVVEVEAPCPHCGSVSTYHVLVKANPARSLMWADVDEGTEVYCPYCRRLLSITPKVTTTVEVELVDEFGRRYDL